MQVYIVFNNDQENSYNTNVSLYAEWRVKRPMPKPPVLIDHLFVSCILNKILSIRSGLIPEGQIFYL